MIGAGQPQFLPSGICLLDHSLSNHLLSMTAAFSQLQSVAPHVSRRLIVLAGIQPGQASIDAAQLALEPLRSEEHTSELQSPCNLVCRLLLEKKKTNIH